MLLKWGIMKVSTKLAAVVGAGMLAASLVAATPAMAATAAPAAAAASCSKPLPQTPSKSGSKVNFGASGSCSTASVLNVRLYHYYAPPFPDVNAAEIEDHTSPYSVSKAVCDGGGSTTYYTKAAFFQKNGSADVTQASPRKTINDHC